MDQIDDVAEFHRAAGLDPARGDLSLTQKRLALVLEEFAELVIASKRQDRIELADALADIAYVALGGLISLFGIDAAKRVWAEVQRSNMAKFPGGQILKNAEGKILKPPGWRPPDISGALDQTCDNPLCSVAPRQHFRTGSCP